MFKKYLNFLVVVVIGSINVAPVLRLTSQINISSTSSSTCKQLENGNSMLYKLSSTNLIEGWSKASGFRRTQNLLYISGGKTVQKIATDSTNSQLAVLYQNSTIQGIDILGLQNLSTILSNSYLYSHEDIVDYSVELSQLVVLVFPTSSYQRNYLFLNNLGAAYFSGPYYQDITSYIGLKMEYSPNKQAYFMWGYDYNLYVFAMINTLFYYRYTFTFGGGVTNLTNHLGFSWDNSLMFFEADHLSNVLIVDISDLNNVSVLVEIPVGWQIYRIVALDKSNDMIGIFGPHRTTFYSIFNRVFSNTITYNLAVNPEVVVDNYINHTDIFMCQDNGILKVESQKIGCVDSRCYLLCDGVGCQCCPNNCVNCNDTGQCNQCFEGFNVTDEGYCSDGSAEQTNLTQLQQKLVEISIPIKAMTSNFLLNTFSYLLFTPFLFYFLKVITFFEITSLYLFLKIDIPDYLYKHIESIYISLNQQMLSLIGIDFKLSKFSDQLVDNQQSLRYDISSDFIKNNLANFMLFGFVMLLTFVMRWIGGKLSKKNPLRKVLKLNIFQVFSGNFISMSINIILPFCFLIKVGFYNFKTKINMMVSHFFIFFAIVFPFVTFVTLVLDNKQNRRRQKIKRSINNKKIQEVKLVKILTVKEFDEFHVALMNVTFPLLLFVQNIMIFLSFNLVILSMGVVKSFYSKDKKINKIILSLYPLIYHCSFIGLWFVQDTFTRSTLSIIALYALLVGSVHQLLSIFAITFYEIGLCIKSIFSFCCPKNKIDNENFLQPSPSQQNQNNILTFLKEEKAKQIRQQKSYNVKTGKTKNYFINIVRCDDSNKTSSIGLIEQINFPKQTDIKASKFSKVVNFKAQNIS